MKLSLFLTPISDRFLAWAAQIGVTDIVAPYPGRDLAVLREQVDRVASFGLKLSVIERHVPHDLLVHRRPGWEEQLAGFCDLIRNMGRLGVNTLCYNWMPDDDWQRTSFSVRERGGALVTEFDLAKIDPTPPARPPTPASVLWESLEAFLKSVVPVAEDCGVKLALHPDDPPLESLRGQERILFNFAACERALNLLPSNANGLCYCQGSFASRGENIVEGIHRFASRINFVHFRDVIGQVPYFRESFHDTGKTNMAACIRAYQAIGYNGPARPDHVPTLDGETNENPGYEMLGRLHAIGYMKGLIDGSRCLA